MYTGKAVGIIKFFDEKHPNQQLNVQAAPFIEFVIFGKEQEIFETFQLPIDLNSKTLLFEGPEKTLFAITQALKHFDFNEETTKHLQTYGVDIIHKYFSGKEHELSNAFYELPMNRNLSDGNGSKFKL
jgi:hypothetical protein